MADNKDNPKSLFASMAQDLRERQKFRPTHVKPVQTRTLPPAPPPKTPLPPAKPAAAPLSRPAAPSPVAPRVSKPPVAASPATAKPGTVPPVPRPPTANRQALPPKIEAAAVAPAPPAAPPVESAPEAVEAAAGGLSADQLFAMAKMGYTQWEYGKLDRARAIFQTLVNQRPNEPWFRQALGSVYQRQRQFAPALQQYNIALQLDPNDLASRVNRGEILLKVGKKQEGVADLQMAVRLDRSGKHRAALRAQSLLNALRKPPALSP